MAYLKEDLKPQRGGGEVGRNGTFSIRSQVGPDPKRNHRRREKNISRRVGNRLAHSLFRALRGVNLEVALEEKAGPARIFAKIDKPIIGVIISK